MSQRDSQLLLEDMIEAIEKALSYVSGMTFGQFEQDSRTHDAVLRNVQIVGEAANRVSKELQEQSPEIDWRRIARSRHILVHDYFATDLEIIWRILEVHFPDLHKDLTRLQNRLNA